MIPLVTSGKLNRQPSRIYHIDDVRGILKKRLGSKIKKWLGKFGLEISRTSHWLRKSPELDQVDLRNIQYVLQNNLTMLPEERLISLVLTCKQIVKNNVPGDFVECGVYRGGASILARLTFDRMGSDRLVYLYDTFSGMTEPSIVDKNRMTGEEAIHKHKRLQRDSHNEWVFCPQEEVEQNFQSAKADLSKVRIVAGDVRQTLPKYENLPKTVSVLRLDTDFYESTLAELNNLYPRLSQGGVLIVDDYGHWEGSAEAVDKYFESGKFQRPVFFADDSSCRSGVKLDA